MKNIKSYSSLPPISWDLLCWWLFILVQKRCSDKMARYGFFSPLLGSRFDFHIFLTNDAYKLTTLKWENSHSFSTCLSSKLSPVCILYEAELWCWNLGSRRIKEFSMDKGKADLHPYNLIMESKKPIGNEKIAVQVPSSSMINNSADGKDGNTLITHGGQDTGTMASSSMMKSSADEQERNNLNNQRDQVKLCAESGIEVNLEDQNEREKLKYVVQIQENLLQTEEKRDMLTTEGVIMKNQIFPKHPLGKTPFTSPELEEGDFVDECFDYEHDDLLIDDPPEMNYQINLGPIGQEGVMGHILISDDPPFSENDLDDFINNEPLELGNMARAPAESYQSAQQSILSSSSFAMEMRKLEVHQMETSNSNSSKRKNMEGVEDTASSKVKGGEKLKN